ncbi:MAG: hypothetical protein NLN65_06020 [Candidatus Poseidoniaceae archaeon]|nr:hypothetical protein [Candidatus Poseidoniaceae archaeon]
MSEIPTPAPKKNKFGASVSFDLEKAPEPKRREKRDAEEDHIEHVHEIRSSATEVGCPGCGQDISEDEWVEALVGFVSGVRDFEIGNSVRSRIVQTLRNTVTNMDTPHPRDVWELSVVARLMEEIERIVQAEILRTSNEGSVQSFSVTEVQEMIQTTELETRNTMAVEIWEDVVVQVQTALEPELRKQIEQELWREFEAELQRRQET